MPKCTIDYRNTIIYKLFCKDPNVTDIYVGHTTNFSQRKYLHKSNVICDNDKVPLYNIIRANGGWENWDMIELEKCSCANYIEAKKREIFYMDINKPIPLVQESIETDVKVKFYSCSCGKTYKDKSGLWRHIKQKGCNKPCDKFYDKPCDKFYENPTCVKESDLKESDLKETTIHDEMTNHFFMELIKQNKESQYIIMEQNKHIIHLSNNIMQLKNK